MLSAAAATPHPASFCAGAVSQKAAGPAAITFRQVTQRFQSASGQSFQALSETDLTIADGEFVSIVCPTRCGKSTLLNIAAGLAMPVTGEVEIYGAPLTGRNERAGYLFQAESLMPWNSAIDNIKLGLVFDGVPAGEAEERAQDWLERVGLAGHGHRYPHQLSGGMLKRVALAQVLIKNPRIILMDEPFSALDIQTRTLMENELLNLWSEDRKSIMFVTHDLEEAISMSDRVILLAAGPGSHPIAEFPIDLERPRDVAEIRHTRAFADQHAMIWDALRAEVLKGYAQSKR